ncbi:MAG: zinc-binding alcohol dehydrogenase [Dehalococcoidia bacterium]|nr:MAG: galactitol-1-phosphate 5-dehydrogenase [Chloroflexota bacterium]
MEKGRRIVSLPGRSNGNRRIEIEEFNVPKISDKQVLVRVSRTQVSAGSETTFVTGEHMSESEKEAPRYTGYTSIGNVLEAGKSMTLFKPGNRVFTYGIHASHWVSEEPDPSNPVNIQHLNFEITDEQAAMSRLGDVALHGVRRAALQIDEKVAVFGVGVVGQLLVSFSRMSGAYPIIAVDMDQHRLDLARESGATHMINASKENAAVAVKEITNGGAQCVFHSNRNPNVLADCMEAAKMRGKVVLVGSPPGTAKVGLQVDLLRRELDIIGSSATNDYMHRYYPWNRNKNREAIWRMIESGDLKVDHLISHVVKPEMANDLYQKIGSGTSGWMGIFFDWT